MEEYKKAVQSLWSQFQIRGDSAEECLAEFKPNAYNLCEGLKCDRDAMCAGGCCVGQLCNASYCEGDSNWMIWVWLIAILCVLTLAIIACLKARKQIAEDKVKENMRKQFLETVLTHDLPDEQDDELKKNNKEEKKAPFKDVTL